MVGVDRALPTNLEVRGALAILAARAAAPSASTWAALSAEARASRARTGGVLPPWPLPQREPAGWRELGGPSLHAGGTAGVADALVAAAEELAAGALGRQGRRRAGVFYTPPALAAEVVALALRHGPPLPRGARVLDPCAGAGAFLLAAARAGVRHLSGMDLDPRALRVARAALWLEGVEEVHLRAGDALRAGPRRPADLLVSNPPYGHVDDPAARSALARRFPALRGQEIDRYAAFLLRALELVGHGRAAALLVPDTWMSNARAGPLRTALLAGAEIAALVDFGKPFAAAKDTRVQCVVLVRGAARGRSTFVGREGAALAPAPRAELEARAAAGWQPYRSRGERALCSALERSAVPLGEVCEVGYGLRTGDNARHVARRPPTAGEVPLIGGEDLVRFGLRWSPKALLEPAAFRAQLSRQLGRERIAVQRIRTNARASWARWLEAAPVPPGSACLDSLSTLACADADLRWALLALVSSVALDRWHRLRTTDVNVKPSALRELPVPRALLSSPRPLAKLARERAALETAGADGVTRHLRDRAIDARVYALFGLSPALAAECERGFWGERFDQEFRLLASAHDQAAEAMSDPPCKVAGTKEDA